MYSDIMNSQHNQLNRSKISDTSLKAFLMSRCVLIFNSTRCTDAISKNKHSAGVRKPIERALEPLNINGINPSHETRRSMPFPAHTPRAFFLSMYDHATAVGQDVCMVHGVGSNWTT